MSRVVLIILILLCSACAPTTWEARNALILDSAPALSDNGSSEALLRAVKESIAYYSVLDRARHFQFGERSVSRDEMLEGLARFKEKLEELGLTEKFFEFVHDSFDFYRPAAGEPLFTGYYEASLNGSRHPSEIYRYPVYKVPPDLLRLDLGKFPQFKDSALNLSRVRGRVTSGNIVVPYHDRQAIDFKGALQGKKLEIVWVDDPIKLFFMEIQGSGVVNLPDGKEIRVNYGESNGLPYRAIGKKLIEEGILKPDNVSMRTIVDYLRAHPERFEEIVSYNSSYVFFREVTEGPIGSIGRPLTPYRSVASDTSLYPRGALIFSSIQVPSPYRHGHTIAVSGFMLNQDTGGAILGPRRVDLFTGRGEESEQIAGSLKEYGKWFFIVPKPVYYPQVAASAR